MLPAPFAHMHSATTWRRLTCMLKAVFFIWLMCASQTMVPGVNGRGLLRGRGRRRCGAGGRVQWRACPSHCPAVLLPMHAR